MSPRDAVRGLAFGRIAIGVLMVLAPRFAGRRFLGDSADTDGAAVLGRALGARDAVLGGMVLHVGDQPQVARRWIATCGGVDAVDCFAALTTGRDVPFFKRLLFVAVAGGSAVAHSVLARQVVSAEGLADVAAQSPPAPASSPETVEPDGADVAKRSMGARTESKL